MKVSTYLESQRYVQAFLCDLQIYKNDLKLSSVLHTKHSIKIEFVQQPRAALIRMKDKKSMLI